MGSRNSTAAANVQTTDSSESQAKNIMKIAQDEIDRLLDMGMAHGSKTNVKDVKNISIEDLRERTVFIWKNELEKLSQQQLGKFAFKVGLLANNDTAKASKQAIVSNIFSYYVTKLEILQALYKVQEGCNSHRLRILSNYDHVKPGLTPERQKFFDKLISKMNMSVKQYQYKLNLIAKAVKGDQNLSVLLKANKDLKEANEGKNSLFVSCCKSIASLSVLLWYPEDDGFRNPVTRTFAHNIPTSDDINKMEDSELTAVHEFECRPVILK